MHRPVILTALALTLSACGTTTGENADFTALPAVSGPLGRRPVVAIPPGRPAATPRVRVLAEGSGPRTKAGDVIVTNVDIHVWRGARPYLSTWGPRQPTTVILDGQHVSGTWARALLDRRAGSRVLLVSPAPLGFGPLGMAPARVSPSDTLVEVFDIIGSYRPNAQVTGDARQRVGTALPRVAVPPGAEPRVAIPRGTPPARPTVRTLTAGTGPALRKGATFVTNYVGVTWRRGRVFDSSYRRGGPTGFVLADGAVPPGWVRGLAGVRVGSRVLMVIPARARRGFTMTPGGTGAPPGQTIVYVLDILDVR